MDLAITKILILVILIGTVACRNENVQEGPVASTKAIGTDLPDNGGTMNVYLYWTNGNRIFRGRCRDGHDVIRTNCTDEIQALPYAAFMEKLDGGLSRTIVSLREESQRIQQAILRLSHQITDVKAELDRLEAEYGDLDQELRRLRTDLQRFETFVSEYREQLRQIDEALAEIDDDDIRAQRLIVVARLTEYQARLVDIGRGIESIVAQVGDINVEIDTLRRELVSLSNRLGNLQTDLADVSHRLQTAVDDFTVYEDTLSRLNSGIIYTVMSDNVILAKQRQFVRRFDTIFSSEQ